VPESIAAIAAAIRSRRYHYATEAELQDGIALALDGVAFRREVALTTHDRIDFLVDGVGIEVKIGGGLTPLLRQLARYAAHSEIAALIVVTTKLQLCRLPDSLAGKPLCVVALPRAIR
jgi:hypothetical protein